MPNDRIVTSNHILKSVMDYERHKSTSVLSELENLEPDLCEYLLENLSRLYHRCMDLGLSGKDARAVLRIARKTATVCILSLRNAHFDLWQDQGDPPGLPPPGESSPQ